MKLSDKKQKQFHRIYNYLKSLETETFLQNIIGAFFLSPFTLITYAFILACKVTFMNKSLIEALSSAVSLILIFWVFALYLMMFYIVYFKDKNSLLKLVKVTILIIIMSFHLYIFIKKDIEHLTHFDNYFIIITSVLISYWLIQTFRKIISSIYNWIFSDESQQRDELIKFKLSFIKSLLIGFFSFIATILGIVLTIKNLFFT
ncbi:MULTISPECIES: hypothetical protein [Staphylococcus]|uniref:hypothetical protein n=1 Tax=Staphylococcus TaxID=1279 RepID=UPI000D350131|nr:MULTISPECIES: hypothetical protein [Staphylococcus]MBM6506728.1 hypothetical protein [Staphylococcus pasteuri]PTU82256.1 hypothetical protein BUZ67_11890 [Staphylococcus pasteuri]QDW85095.1 hypothetical protein DWB95_09265 [Staphylococcus pasteuri]QQN53590.1 hypothetical protein I6I26_09440 [Staphylococcus pasteuri]QQT21500.1 hypothetical protein I6J08_06205 [Staphylococcus pasteuri]